MAERNLSLEKEGCLGVTSHRDLPGQAFMTSHLVRLLSMEPLFLSIVHRLAQQVWSEHFCCASEVMASRLGQGDRENDFEKVGVGNSRGIGRR